MVFRFGVANEYYNSDSHVLNLRYMSGVNVLHIPEITVVRQVPDT